MADPENDEEACQDEAAQPFPLRDAVLKDCLQQSFQHNTKITPAAVALSSVFIRAFVDEACSRAAAEAAASADSEVTEEHLEKVLPQLLLDMGP